MLYNPEIFSICDKNRQIDFIKKFSFASIFSITEGSISHLTKIPLLLKEYENELYLEGHLAKTNPHWNFLKNQPLVTVIFDGPHDYVSPTWYVEPTKNVPTWNYMTVVINGTAKVMNSKEWLIQSIMELTDKYEKNSSWKNSVDQNLLQQLSQGIIGLRIKVEEIQAKFKLSQNRDEASRLNVIKKFKEINKELASQMDLIK